MEKVPSPEPNRPDDPMDTVDISTTEATDQMAAPTSPDNLELGATKEDQSLVVTRGRIAKFITGIFNRNNVQAVIDKALYNPTRLGSDPTSPEGLNFEPEKDLSKDEQKMINEALHNSTRLGYIPEITNEDKPVEIRRSRIATFISDIFGRSNSNKQNVITEVEDNPTRIRLKEQRKNERIKYRKRIKDFFDSNPSDFTALISQNVGSSRTMRVSRFGESDIKATYLINYKINGEYSDKDYETKSIDALDDTPILKRIHEAVKASEPYELDRRLRLAVQDYHSPSDMISKTNKPKPRNFKRRATGKKEYLLQLEGPDIIISDDGQAEKPLTLHVLMDTLTKQILGYQLDTPDKIFKQGSEFHPDIDAFSPAERLHITTLLDTPPQEDTVGALAKELLDKKDLDLSPKGAREMAIDTLIKENRQKMLRSAGKRKWFGKN